VGCVCASCRTAVALAGDHGGADASVTIGAGIGTNALIGGFERSLALQPLSVEAQSGLALAAGVADDICGPEGEDGGGHWLVESRSAARWSTIPLSLTNLLLRSGALGLGGP
jgi:hypothetical protein